jgi:hypothetical protein
MAARLKIDGFYEIDSMFIMHSVLLVLEGLKGELKIRVMASDFDTTLATLKKLENQLPDGTSMAEINIKMGDDSADWYATHGTSDYADLVSDLSSRFNANVLTYSPSGPNKGSYAYRYERGKHTEVNGLAGSNGMINNFAFHDTGFLGRVFFFYQKNNTTTIYNTTEELDDNKIPVALIDSNSYSEQELLEQFKGAGFCQVSCAKVFCYLGITRVYG